MNCISPKPVESLLAAMLVLLALFTGPVFAEITSDTHPALEKVFKNYPEVDRDKNGVMSWSEYQSLIDKKSVAKRKLDKTKKPVPIVGPNGDMPLTDFEESSYSRMSQQGWKIEGEVFRHSPSTATRIMKKRVGSYSGKYILSSLVGGDRQVGQMLSPLFDVELEYLQLLISGGKRPGQICVNLIVDDQVVRTVTGRNDDYLELVAFDIADFQGRQARVQIIDNYRGVWGHINVDNIYQTDHLRTERIIDLDPNEHRIDGLVHTVSGRHLGELMIAEGHITVDQKAIELDDLLLAVCQLHPDQPRERHALRLKNGEVWRVEILKLEKNQMWVQSTLFGKRAVPLSQIASLDFKPDAIQNRGTLQPGTLYRTNGDPIPGKLVWIRDKDIAIECVLGVVPVPRNKVASFVLAAVAPKSGQLDEIGLANGSLLRGKIAIDGDKIVLGHSMLGELRLGWQVVKYLQRTPGNVTWLEQLKTVSLNQTGPVASPPPPTVTDSRDQKHLRAIRMMPHTIASYALPPRGATIDKAMVKFRGELTPVPGCRTDMHVEILVEGKAVWQKKILSGSEPIRVEVDLPAAKPFAISVKFDGRLAFPCGVDWRDAHLLAMKTGQGE